MNTHTTLIDSAKHGLRLLDRRPLNTAAYVLYLQDQLRKQASRKLRKAVQGDTVTDLDIDVVKDLMKVMKKLRGKENGDCRELDRLKLTLELVEFTIDKKKPISPDQIVWIFNRIYNKLSWVTKHEDIARQAVDAMWYHR